MKLFNAAAIYALSLVGFASATFDCPNPVKYGWEKDKNGVQNSKGDFADTEVDWPFGMDISTDNSNHRPMLFDTGMVTGGDSDLASDEGLVLIVSEDNDDSDPDDKANGGVTITIDFNGPAAKIDSIGFLDIEESGGTIKITQCNNNVINRSIPVGGNGNKSRQNNINRANICKLEIEFAGSGAVTDIEFCRGDGGAMGDPHIMKWDGGYFDYHGKCDLLLVDAPKFGNGAGLMMQIRTKIVEEYSFSFVRNLAMQIGEDVLEIVGYGKYFLNGEAAEELPAQIGGGAFPLSYNETGEYQHEYIISTDSGISLKTSTLGEYVSVTVETSEATHTIASEWFGSSTGLMGTFGGLLLARDGKTIMTDANEFGQEWQVRDNEPNLFHDKDHAPQYPAKCILPAATPERRLRGISREAAEKACAHVTNHKEACIFDVQATNDVGLAKIHN